MSLRDRILKNLGQETETRWRSFLYTAVNFNWEDLGDFAYSLGASRTEQESRSRSDEFRMLQEAEKNGRRIVGRDVFLGHYSFQDGRLLDAANVHRRLEPLVHACRMKQHNDCSLSTKMQQVLMREPSITI